ncbi:MFS transporter [Nocardiopsis dassonvillei]|uniref:MFS transporter n=1 Tax=Nocardiopsis dassonvillei TaxID=2014 RepID=UPI00200F6E03|nr:MFS transporter [Nocardiopsis dassonvillei]MCK9873492.1 MFS transporter [Nocardiopsis dassonvillei]
MAESPSRSPLSSEVAPLPSDPGATPSTAIDDGKLPPFFSLKFSTRGVSLAVNVLVVMQLTFYATDSVGLSAGLIGGLFLAAKLFDGVTDILAGFAIDRTKSRWGRARPYELLIVPIWITTVAAFSTPDMPQVWQAAYLFVMFVLITSVFQTLLAQAEGVFLKRSLTGETRYAKVLSRQGVLIILVAAVANIALPQLIDLWGNQPGGWTLIAAVYGVPMMLIGLVRFWLIRESAVSDEEAAAEKRVFVREGLGSLLRNKYAFVMAGMVLLVNVVFTSNGIIGTYYFKYVLGDVGLLSIVMAAGAVVPFIYLVFPLAVRTIGAINFVRINLFGAVIGFGLVTLFPEVLGLVVVGQMLGSLTTVITMLVGFFMLQCMSYGEWRSGVRADAVTTSVVNLAGKTGQGIASGLIGLILSAAGYNGLVEMQTPEAESAIIALYSVVPLVLSAAVLGLSYLYRLDGKVHEIRAELKAGVHAEASDIKL